MLLLNLGVLLLAGHSLPPSVSATETTPSQGVDKVCDVKAWVRAEDLSPDTLINGPLTTPILKTSLASLTAI